MLKCFRSCFRNTNVSIVWGMRRMAVGRRFWREKGERGSVKGWEGFLVLFRFV